MCVSVPGRVVSVHEIEGAPAALVDFGGKQRSVNLMFLPDVVAGDHVLTHSGFAVRLAEPFDQASSPDEAGSPDEARAPDEAGLDPMDRGVEQQA